MIGYREQSTVRRPIYSTTGIKLGYLVDGPNGHWWTTVSGKRIGRIKKFKPVTPKEIGTTVSGSYINAADIDV